MVVGERPTLAQTTAIGDRYSGEMYRQPAYRQPANASGPLLTWPGKTAAAGPAAVAPTPAPAYAYTPQTYRPTAPAAEKTPVYQPPAYPAPSYPAQLAQGAAQQTRVYGPAPVRPWYQRYEAPGVVSGPEPASPPPSTPHPGAPQSIYDPPPEKVGAAMGASAAPSSTAAMGPAARPATAANDGETARFYSLHRQYGLTPDPDPIPPQFFTQTADLSDPPGPSPVYKAASTGGGSTTAVHPAQSDDSNSTLGQP